MSCNSLFNCYSPFVTTLCVCDSLLCGKIVNGRQSYDVALTGTLDVLIRTAISPAANRPGYWFSYSGLPWRHCHRFQDPEHTGREPGFPQNEDTVNRIFTTGCHQRLCLPVTFDFLWHFTDHFHFVPERCLIPVQRERCSELHEKNLQGSFCRFHQGGYVRVNYAL